MGGMERWRSYDAVAEAYDLGRPGYPEALINDCVRLAGLGPDSRILEIGCGSGQATRSFAVRGFRMTCLEPGASLANIAARNLSAYPGVAIREEKFEDWPLEPEAFDLVLAATSIHHVANAVRYMKSARALKPGGAIAVVGNQPGNEDPDFRKELDVIYARWWGEDSARIFAKQTLENRIAATKSQIEDSGQFGPVTISQHPWKVEYDVPRYMALLISDSGRLNHLLEAQEGLQKDIAAAIVRRGGRVFKGYVAVLALAKRRQA
jgi:SAM-dependent methyltransferase